MRCSWQGSARSALFGAVAVAALAAGGAASAEVLPSGDPALYWNQVLASGIAGPPVFATRTFAIVSTGIHDAVNATSGFPDYAYVKGVATSGGDTRAATAVAAHTLLVTLHPTKQADYDAALAASLALVPDGAAKTQGMATGAAIAAATLERRSTDGAFAPSTYSPTPGIGNWQPTPPAFAPALGAQWGDQTPWILDSGDQFRPGPPPPVGSPAYVTAYLEVMDIGSATSLTRSADQTAASTFWATPGVNTWAMAGVGLAEGAGLSTIENARLFALLHVSVADALIGVWDSKFEYDFWRPVTAIRTDDGDPLTPTDIEWLSFLTNPPYPDYASGLSGVAGASSTVLASFFGDDTPFCLTQAAVSRCYTSFSDAALEGANSRLWGGIHFRFANEQGLLLGQNAADFALDSIAFDAVPEPATWAMMILGFGGVGALMRRRRTALA